MKKSLKTLTIIGVVMSMALGVFVLAGCNDISLVNYKNDACAKIQNHTDTKVESDYSADKWAALCDAVIAGKAAVEAAENKAKVDLACVAAIQAIDLICNFENSEFLSKELCLQIKQDYLNSIVKPLFSSATIADIKIEKYYGTYDCLDIVKWYDGGVEDRGKKIAVMLSNTFNDYSNGQMSVKIDDWNRQLNYVDGRRIYFWEDGNLLELSEALSQGLGLNYRILRYVHQTDFVSATKININNISYEKPGDYGFLGYYGSYNGVYAIRLQESSLAVSGEEIVAGITFSYPYRDYMYIINNATGGWHRLQEAYDLGLLTVENIAKLRDAYHAEHNIAK